MRTIQLMAAALLAATTVMGQGTPTKPSQTSKGVQKPSAAPTLNVITVQGCFTDPGELKFNSTPQFNDEGSCVKAICFNNGFEVAGTTGGNQCFCGHKYPPKSALTDDKKCNIGCAGFDQLACGGVGTWTIYNTGRSVVVDTVGEDSIKGGSGSGTTTKSPTQTVTNVSIITEPPAPSGGGTNIGAIAGGVVVGVLAVAGGIFGMFFYMRRKRNREIEEEHHRNAAVNSFISGKTGSSGGSIHDARLDPVVAQRRMSDGSIADNQDYSRKILRVTNA